MPAVRGRHAAGAGVGRRPPRRPGYGFTAAATVAAAGPDGLGSRNALHGAPGLRRAHDHFNPSLRCSAELEGRTGGVLRAAFDAQRRARAPPRANRCRHGRATWPTNTPPRHRRPAARSRNGTRSTNCACSWCRAWIIACGEGLRRAPARIEGLRTEPDCCDPASAAPGACSPPRKSHEPPPWPARSRKRWSGQGRAACHAELSLSQTPGERRMACRLRRCSEEQRRSEATVATTAARRGRRSDSNQERSGNTAQFIAVATVD